MRIWAHRDGPSVSMRFGWLLVTAWVDDLKHRFTFLGANLVVSKRELSLHLNLIIFTLVVGLEP